MLEIARPEARSQVRSQPRRFTWGIVDVILGAAMLPFGIWMFVIERLARGAAWLFER
jgi:hypothetical protein